MEGKGEKKGVRRRVGAETSDMTAYTTWIGPLAEWAGTWSYPFAEIASGPRLHAHGHAVSI